MKITIMKFKSLVRYLKEELESNTVQNLVVTYKVLPDKITLQCPNNYSEDLVTQYLQDLWFNDLPGGDDTKDKLLGVNAEKLIDVYLQYEDFSHSKDKINAGKDIEWDSKKDPDNDQELEWFSLSNITYNLSFEEFTLKESENDDTDSLLEKVFKALESNAYNKYPIEIKFDKVEYDK